MALYQFLCTSAVMITLLSKAECGRAFSNNKIVGGQNASPGSWPWQVVLTANNISFCSGSLIHHRWVITAAHCLTGGDLDTTEVVLGRHSQSGTHLNEETRGLDRIECHPSYRFLTNDNDICLLKLSAPVTFTEYIQPVCLASADSTFHAGVMSWITGFGSTDPDTDSPADVLQEVDVPIVGNNQCRCTYPLITDNMICAGHEDGGKDACLGDSGGPLVTKKGSAWILSGIVSFGKGCAVPMIPGGYTRVSRYQEWIKSITGYSTPAFVTYVSSGEDSDLTYTCSKSLDSEPIATNTIKTTTTTTTTTTPATTTTTTKKNNKEPLTITRSQNED
ncbi:tryptase-like [Centropristis striata]|uniref:tryptase-like n=1 Tax=Centropristis striata TaxID=184440 RepID=UPI0027E0ECF2|nr:tryptase-like [Centropristis striata]